MKTRSVIVVALALAVAVLTAPFFAADASTEDRKAAARKPDVILFLVDDMGWSDLTCYGSPFYETPNIDHLASEGVRFTDAYATCHVCSPSRASVLTGKYPARLDLTDWLTGRREFPFQRLQNAPIHQALPLEEVTLAESLRRHGYRTGHFGKWHLGEHPNGPLQQGFDVQVPANWYKGWPKAGYHAPFELDGIVDQPGDYLTDRLTDEALKFIGDNSDEPFFLYLSHFAVHDPIQGRSDLVAKYEKKRSRLPTDDTPFILEGNPDAKISFTRAERDAMIDDPAYADYRVLPNQMVKIKQRQDNPQFAAMVEAVDESLGRIVAKLKSLGREENTIIIFTSDNGGMSAANFGNPRRVVHPSQLDAAYSTSNLPLRGAKGWLYEGGIRVPLIIKWPGHGVAGSICSEPVIGTDYYPTILDMIGVGDLSKQHADGESLCPLLQGATTLDRDAIFWHFPHYSNHGMQSPGGAIRSGKYKLLEYFENGTVQLFDLEADPGEQNDLSEAHPEIVAQLLDRLHRWREDVDAKMMSPNPDFDASAAVQQ
jgi:arylsulfatase A-like enzyme